MRTSLGILLLFAALHDPFGVLRVNGSIESGDSGGEPELATGITTRTSTDFDEAVDEGIETRERLKTRQKVVTLPLTADNVFAILVILLLACVGDPPPHVHTLFETKKHVLTTATRLDRLPLFI